ncbi:hypothetical protein OQA88_6654 [Cercophora sp. LCS_1]
MADETFAVHTSLLFDPKKKLFLNNISIEISRPTGSVVNVITRPSDEIDTSSPDDIDLRGKLVLPGFVDSHTHIFLYDYRERSGTEQMRDESTVERVVRATNHVRSALLAGYTTYRDLGTESLGNADANLRDCINRGLLAGPRLFVATEALASTGSYELRVENRLGNPLTVPRACDPADGVNGVRAAVRRRVGDGADLIKFYADYRRKVMRFPTAGPRPVRFPPETYEKRNPAVPLYEQEEMDAIVQEARLADLPVAAHAGETKAARMALRAGVTTVEHVFEDHDGVKDKFFEDLKKYGAIWVPTLCAGEATLRPDQWGGHKELVRKGWEAGVRLAAGGDTGTVDHGLNVHEMELMMQLGIPVEDVLVAATVVGWEACGGDKCGYRFGWFEKGNRADIIALDTDPRVDKRALRKVSFVMKDGEVWKRDGVAVGMIQTPGWEKMEGSPSPSPRSSEDWTEVQDTEQAMEMSVPPPVCCGLKKARRSE